LSHRAATAALRAQVYATGTVKVSLNGVLVGCWKFRQAVAGGIGAGAVKAASQFDNYKVLDDSVLR